VPIEKKDLEYSRIQTQRVPFDTWDRKQSRVSAAKSPLVRHLGL
jgi:hypothetical protein